MYTYYLTRELSRAEKLNGIVTKDISITGSDASKRVTLADLELQLNKAKDMLNKQKPLRLHKRCLNEIMVLDGLFTYV